MLIFRKNYGIVVYEGLVYVVGGIIKIGGVIRSVEFYDLRINIWFSVLLMRREVVGVGVVMVGDFLYVVGGYDVKGRL